MLFSVCRLVTWIFRHLITTVFIDTRLWKTKHPQKRFQNFRQSCELSTDRIKIHQSQPLVWPSDLLFVMLVGSALVKIFVGSLKILEDLHEDPYADLRRSLWNILKDLKGSFKFLPRSSRTSPISLKILEGLCMYVEDLCRNFVNPWRSLQDLYRSL